MKLAKVLKDVGVVSYWIVMCPKCKLDNVFKDTWIIDEIFAERAGGCIWVCPWCGFETMITKENVK
jgi:phage FluMu protein Com